MENYMLISADDHIDLGYLPRDLWTERLPKHLRERGPRVEERGEQDLWICDGQSWGEWRAGRWFFNPKRSIIALDRIETNPDIPLSRRFNWRASPEDTDNFTTRPTTPELRLEDMDKDGVQVSVMYPPIFGMRTEDKELAQEIIRAYNDWAFDFASAKPERLIAIAQLYPDDAEASTNELLRIAKKGMKEVNFLVGTVTSDMYQPDWDRFWDAAEDTGTIVTFHAGGVSSMGTFTSSSERSQTQGERKAAFGMGIGDSGVTFYEPFIGLFRYGVLERRPKLRFVLGESGTGWVPFVVQEMEGRFETARERAGADFPLKRSPSEVFREQVWATYQQDEVGLHLIDFFGPGHIMWASDYPHPDSIWPFSREVIARETAHLSDEERKKIVRDNAKDFFGLD